MSDDLRADVKRTADEVSALVANVGGRRAIRADRDVSDRVWADRVLAACADLHAQLDALDRRLDEREAGLAESER